MKSRLSVPARISIALGSAVLVASLAAPAVLGAPPALLFRLDMYSNCVEGSGAQGPTVNVVWRNSNGTLKAQASTASSNGTWSFCSSDQSIWLAPLDKLNVSDGSSTRSYVVPNLSMAVDRVSELVTGTGPAGRTLRLCPYRPFNDFVRCHSVRIAQDGTWEYRDGDGITGATIDIRWVSPNGDELYMSAQSQELNVTLGKSTTSGTTGIPRGMAHLELNNGSKATADVISDRYGQFSAQFVDDHGHPVNVIAGDHVTASIASDADWIVPTISATPDRVNDTVTGVCEQTPTAETYLQVEAVHSGHHRGWALADTDESGNFTADFRDPGGFFSDTNIIRGDRLIISCYQQRVDTAQLKVIVN